MELDLLSAKQHITNMLALFEQLGAGAALYNHEIELIDAAEKFFKPLLEYNIKEE